MNCRSTRSGSARANWSSLASACSTPPASRSPNSRPDFPLQIELDYLAVERLVAPIFFWTRILREDGLVCYDLTTVASTVSLSEIQGARVPIVLRIDRLDAGRYLVDVACYAQDWAYAYDYHVSASSFLIRGANNKDAVLNVPHRWELTPATAHPDEL